MAFAAVTELTSQVWPSLPVEYFQPRWYAAYTCARHEKRVAEQLQQRSVELFLPLYETVHRWRNGRARVTLPLFPGYVFVHIALKDRLRVLEIPSVVRLVGFNGSPTALPDDRMEALKNGLAIRLRAEPHPYLSVGRKVRVKSGPLQGVEGILARKKGNLRVVLSIELLMRSIAVDVDAADIEPVASSYYYRYGYGHGYGSENGSSRAFTDEALRQEPITRGYKNAARFSWQRTAQQTLQLYQDTSPRGSNGVRSA